MELRGPESQVVPQQLHDQGGVLVLILIQGVDLSDGVLEGLLGELDGLVGVVEDLVLEDGVVQTETETDGVGGVQLARGEVGGLLVGSGGLLGSLGEGLVGGELSQVPVVISLHLVEENLGLSRGGRGDEVLIEESDDVTAEGVQLLLDGLSVLLDLLDVGGVALGLLLLLDGRDDPPGSTAGTDDVLVGDREQVPLLDGELNVELGNGLHGLDHLVVPLGRLGQLGHKNRFFALVSHFVC